MDNLTFSFKKFKVNHGKSSMKVGVDAVLLGAWVSVENVREILEIGVGCGVISLIIAQRNPDAKILGIDIDPPSIDEAGTNFHNSAWHDNLSAKLLKFPEDLDIDHKFDLIVSNPPYFDSGFSNPSTSREIARHQGFLSVFSIIEHAGDFLNPGGRVSMIFPMEFIDRVIEKVEDKGLTVTRICSVRNNPNRPEKRVMIDIKNDSDRCKDIVRESLVLFENGVPTEHYSNLCHDLYLKF